MLVSGVRAGGCIRGRGISRHVNNSKGERVSCKKEGVAGHVETTWLSPWQPGPKSASSHSRLCSPVSCCIGRGEGGSSVCERGPRRVDP